MQSDTFYLLHVTEPLMNGNPQLELTLIHAQREYFLPPPARQPSNNFFDTNDSRILGGFESNGTIQFVQSTMDTTTGLAGIYHGFITDIYGTPGIYANVISDSVRDFGFPNIAWSGYYPGDGNAMISFNYVSPVDFAGMGAIHFRPDSTYSDMTILQTGNAVINVISGPDERWGDYSGIQRRYNDPCKAWAAGSYAKGGNLHGTWIAELGASDTCSANPFAGVAETANEGSIHVFPNPFSEQFSMEFYLENTQEIEISLYDINGKLVQLLLNDKAKQGNNIFSFSTGPLQKGIYFIQIRSLNGKLIKTEKVVKYE